MLQRVRHMKQRTGSGKYDRNVLFLQAFHRLQCFLVMILPNILSIDKSRKQDFVSRKAVRFDQAHRLFSLQKIKADSVEIHCCEILVNIPYITEICLHQNTAVSFFLQNRVIKAVEQLHILRIHIADKGRLIKLYPGNLLFLTLLQQFLIGCCEIPDEILRFLYSGESAKLQHRVGSNHNRFCRNAKLFCLRILIKKLGRGKMDDGVIFCFRYNIMVVGVEPFFHCQCFYITGCTLISSCHGKVGIQCG